jgi:hypothetical protein
MAKANQAENERSEIIPGAGVTSAFLKGIVSQGVV